MIDSKDAPLEGIDRKKNKWKDENAAYRVGIFYPPKRLEKPVWAYTDDLHEAKTISAYIKHGSFETKEAFNQKLLVLTKYLYNVNLANTTWNIMLEMHEKRSKLIMDFHFFGEALRVLAQKHNSKEIELLKAWNDLNMKRKKKVALRSTFVYG